VLIEPGLRAGREILGADSIAASPKARAHEARGDRGPSDDLASIRAPPRRAITARCTVVAPVKLGIKRPATGPLLPDPEPVVAYCINDIGIHSANRWSIDVVER
jgi:hypothetical protein